MSSDALVGWQSSSGRGLRRAFGRVCTIGIEAAECGRRGFVARDSSHREHFEDIGRVFIGGYNSMLTMTDFTQIRRMIDAVSPGHRGYIVEGAAMGAALQASLLFYSGGLQSLIAAFSDRFDYLLHVGMGWTMARVPWTLRRVRRHLDPIHWWLLYDGLGFHDTYFYHREVIGGWQREGRGYAAHTYDQGVGRALWFVAGGDLSAAMQLVGGFPRARRSDLLAGLGLAIAYAGPVDCGEVVGLTRLLGGDASQFAQGVAFACEARVKAGHIPSHSEVVADVVWGMDATALSGLVRETHRQLPREEQAVARYEIWRRRLRTCFRDIESGQGARARRRAVAGLR